MDLGGMVLIVVRMGAFALGIFLVFTTLFSAVRTFILPRSAPDQIVRAVFLIMRRIFDWRLRKAVTYEQRDQVMALYGPLSLIMLQVVWLGIVTLGFALMYWAIGIQARDALLLSESAVLTLGAAQISGLAETTFVYGEAVVGLLLTAILIAYLPTIYAAFSAREMLVNLLEVRAGSPPSPTTLFERYSRLRTLGDLHNLWAEWELWFAQLEETHTSLAVLPFFRSPQPNRSWITAAGAVLDAAALSLALLDLPDDAQAMLTIRAGFLALRQIADFFAIPYNPNPQPTDKTSISRQEFDELCQELADAGISLKADRDQAWRTFNGWRVNYDVPLIALARLVMAPYAPWSSDRSIRWNRPPMLLWRTRPKQPKSST